MTHFFALMLWIAGGLAFVANLPELGIANCCDCPSSAHQVALANDRGLGAVVGS